MIIESSNSIKLLLPGRMAGVQQALGDSSGSADSLPNEKEKEIEKLNTDLERSAPTPAMGDKTTDDSQRMAVTDWEGPNDPENPQNWSAPKKLYHVLVPTILGFVV